MTLELSEEGFSTLVKAVADELLRQGILPKADPELEDRLTGLPMKAAFKLKELEQLLSLSYDTLYDHFHSGILKGRQVTNGKLGLGTIVIWRWSVLEFMNLEKEAEREKQRAQNLLTGQRQ